MREQRHWWVRWSAEIVVLALLLAGAASLRFDLGQRWFGWAPVDPATEPAAVLPPLGLKLPATAEVPAVSGDPRAVAADPAKVAAALRPLLGRPGILGSRVGVLVGDLTSGTTVFRSGPTTITPASTTKLLTTTAALETLGPMARFSTTARYDATQHLLVLVGGGDPLLASTPSAASAYPRRADLTTLARAAVRALTAQGVRRVSLAYDDSEFSGPAVDPAWPATYLGTVVSPITALWVDEARASSGEGYVGDPSAAAAGVFAAALRRAGLKVRPQVAHLVSPAAAVAVAQVSSPPLGEIVEHTLAFSDNQAAEVLARHVGLAERQVGSFSAGTASVLAVLRRLGIDDSGATLYDGSGLSRRDRLRTDTLAAVLRLAASPAHPSLRQVLTGLPVAGFTGSLQNRFDQGPADARGRVRAKTGTLTGVHALAGIADDASGAQLVFVVVADRVPPLEELAAQDQIDKIAGALGACRCGVGSAS